MSLSERAGIGLLVSQENLVPLNQTGSSALALSRIDEVTVENTDGPGIVVHRVALVEASGRPFIERSIPILESRVSGSSSVGAFFVDSAVDLVASQISGAAGAGIWGAGYAGAMVNNVIEDVDAGEFGGFSIGYGMLVSRSPSRPELFSRIAEARLISNSIRGSAECAAVVAGNCEVNATMLFDADDINDNGLTGDAGLVVAGAVDEACLAMVEGTRNDAVQAEVCEEQPCPEPLGPRVPDLDDGVVVGASCDGGMMNADEVCNGLDDDCDDRG